MCCKCSIFLHVALNHCLISSHFNLKDSLSISWRADLLVTDSFSFCLGKSWLLLHSFYILSKNSYSTDFCLFFSYSILNMFSHCLLASMIFMRNKLFVLLKTAYMWWVAFLLLLLLTLAFDSLTITCLQHESLWVSPVWSLLGFLDV